MRLVAVVNSQMLRELRRVGVQVRGLEVRPLEDKYSEAREYGGELYTNHLRWELEGPGKEYLQMIKYVKVYRNG